MTLTFQNDLFEQRLQDRPEGSAFPFTVQI